MTANCEPKHILASQQRHVLFVGSSYSNRSMEVCQKKAKRERGIVCEDWFVKADRVMIVSKES